MGTQRAVSSQVPVCQPTQCHGQGTGYCLPHHFHMLFLDGVYVDSTGSSTRFRWVKAPTSSELNQLSHTVAHRLARYLERQGLL